MFLFVGGQMFNLVPATARLSSASGAGGWGTQEVFLREDDLLWIWEANQDAEDY